MHPYLIMKDLLKQGRCAGLNHHKELTNTILQTAGKLAERWRE